jgi:hypothetical protein
MLSMVVPVPWRLVELLKLETRMSPAASGPPPGNPLGTKATPYGFSSPLAGTVETVSGVVAARRVTTGLVSSGPGLEIV